MLLYVQFSLLSAMSSEDHQATHPNMEDGGILDAVVNAFVGDTHQHHHKDDAATSAMIGKCIGTLARYSPTGFYD